MHCGIISSARRRSGAVGSIQFVGAKTVTYTAGTTQTVSLTDLKDTSNASATLQQNDVVIVTMLRTSTSNLGAAAVSPSSAGYTLISNLYADLSWDANFGANYKFMGGTPDTSVDLPGTGGGGMAVHILALRGVNVATPLDVTVTTVTSTGAVALDPAAITPVTAGALISIHGGGAASGFNLYTNSADLSTATNQFLSAGIDGSGAGGSTVVCGMKTDWVSGAFDAGAFGNGPGGTGDSRAAVTVAWRPA